jgi:hypothetical protein
MNPNYTHTSILLDASGSMYSIKEDTIGGFNEFIEDQKKQDGKMTVTLAQFSYSNDYRTINEMSDVKDIFKLDESSYVTGGGTALLDSVAKLIKDTGNKLAALPEDERPGKVIVTIITDGGENASQEMTKQALADMIKHQEEKYNWNFSYIGANQDAFEEANSFGLASNTANFAANSKGVKQVFRGMSKSYASYRADTTLESNYSLNQSDIDEADVS